MKLLKRDETFIKDKEVKHYTAFYLDLENGLKPIKIKSVYKADYNTLYLSAKTYEK